MSDIVERLENASYENAPSRCFEAAAEIKRLRTLAQAARKPMPVKPFTGAPGAIINGECSYDWEMDDGSVECLTPSEVAARRAAQPPAAPAPLMDAGSMFTFLRERMKDDTSASLIVACRALHDHLRVQAAPAAPVETECDTVKHMWGQVEKARADGTFSSPLSCSSAATDRAADLTDAQLEDLRSHIRGGQPNETGTYDYELGSGWRCFHCGEMFRTWGGASLHFGKPADKRPTCVLNEPQTPTEREKKLLAEKLQDKKDLYDYCVRADAAEDELKRFTSGQKWRHLKRGSIVTEIARGFAQVSAHPIEEMTAVVIYRHDEDGMYWVRNAVEFDDGRFEPYPVTRPEGNTP